MGVLMNTWYGITFPAIDRKCKIHMDNWRSILRSLENSCPETNADIQWHKESHFPTFPFCLEQIKERKLKLLNHPEDFSQIGSIQDVPLHLSWLLPSCLLPLSLSHCNVRIFPWCLLGPQKGKAGGRVWELPTLVPLRDWNVLAMAASHCHQREKAQLSVLCR